MLKIWKACMSLWVSELASPMGKPDHLHKAWTLWTLYISPYTGSLSFSLPQTLPFPSAHGVLPLGKITGPILLIISIRRWNLFCKRYLYFFPKFIFIANTDAYFWNLFRDKIGIINYSCQNYVISNLEFCLVEEKWDLTNFSFGDFSLQSICSNIGYIYSGGGRTVPVYQDVTHVHKHLEN